MEKGTNRDYGWMKEDEGWEKLESFNTLLQLRELGRTPRNYPNGDASGYTSVGDYVNIEIKVRDFNYEDGILSGETSEGKTYTADTLFIETHKCGDMLLDYVVEGKIPLYVNFIGDYAFVYNLSRLKKRPKQVTKKIWSKLYQGFELSKRQELPISEAYIYKLIENKWFMIKKP